MSSTMLSQFKIPVAMLTLVSIILFPVAFVSADEGEHPEKRHRPLPIQFEITSVSDNEFRGTLVRVPGRLMEQEGIEVGESFTVTYSGETKFIEDRTEVDASAFEAGETIFALGPIDFETLRLEARAIVDRPRRMHRPYFHIGEVVEVDADAGTVLVQSLQSRQQEGEEQYVLVSYGEDTNVREDGEQVDLSAISVGDKIHARGEVNRDSEEYLVEIDAQHIELWDEKEPKRPHRKHAKRQ